MKRITTAMMADAMGVPVQAIRVGLQQEKLKFGTAYKQSGSQYTYVIYPEAARETLGPDRYNRMMEKAGAAV